MINTINTYSSFISCFQHLFIISSQTHELHRQQHALNGDRCLLDPGVIRTLTSDCLASIRDSDYLRLGIYYRIDCVKNWHYD